MDRERAAYVALALTPGIGPTRMHAIVHACQTASGAFSAPFAFLRALPGMNDAAATAVMRTGLEGGVQAVEAAGRLGGRVVIPADAEYPELFRHLAEPPTVLFTIGDLGLLQTPAVAIVGSRNHSAYGGEVTRALAWAAAGAGIAVASGMARGLDAVAHTAALEAGGPTIGVLGNGLGVIYPAANRRLYERVAARGLLLTEFPPGERPTAGSFPRRNRLISGLARVTVVVEAAEGSGALITASAALDQGREVMVVPGNITSATSVGANRLIRDGAMPLLGAEDLLQHYPEVSPPVGGPAAPPVTRPLPDTLDEAGWSVAELLGAEAVLLEDLVLRTGRPPQELLATLCGLEIAGVVEQTAGRRFRRL